MCDGGGKVQISRSNVQPFHPVDLDRGQDSYLDALLASLTLTHPSPSHGSILTKHIDVAGNRSWRKDLSNISIPAGLPNLSRDDVIEDAS